MKNSEFLKKLAFDLYMRELIDRHILHKLCELKEFHEILENESEKQTQNQKEEESNSKESDGRQTIPSEKRTKQEKKQTGKDVKEGNTS